ncbi:MAG: long-chain fatty acid transporter [Proteobacteria bacterium]|nr:long-chain fatty acid transporter [Pseudomonadota bacterium]
MVQLPRVIASPVTAPASWQRSSIGFASDVLRKNNRRRRWLRIGIAAAGIALAAPALATNGYFQIGYGAKSVGMGGAAVANPQDTVAAAANPAGMAHVGEGFDIGFRLFSPQREATLDCTGTGCSQPIHSTSANELFFIPDGGYVTKINDKMFAGVSLYGNGGMNTSYGTNLYAEAAFQSGFPPLPGPAPPGAGTAFFGELGVNLAQFMIAPTVTYNVSEKHSFGISPVIGIQRFQAKGLGVFGGLSSDPTMLTNNGADYSYGMGVRIGWLGEVARGLKLGATYASKTYMTKLDEYSGLFADGGSFDIPANAGFGIAIEPMEKLTIAADVQRIFYGDVDSIANAGPTAAEMGGMISADRRMGARNGIGFGWQDTWNFKLGVKYDLTKAWTLRAGYNYGESPIPDEEVLINILAPGIVENHLTLGFSFRSSKNSEWNFSYMHAFENTQSDPMTSFGGAPAEISMSQNAVNLSYSMHFD